MASCVSEVTMSAGMDAWFKDGVGRDQRGSQINGVSER